MSSDSPSPRPPLPVIPALAEHRLWLTFDDGPHQTRTPALLDILRAAKLTATFFVVGARAAHQPDLLGRMVAEGHRVGNHSYSHARLTGLDEAAIRREIALTDAVIAPFTGPDKLFRPPFGASDARVERAAAALGYRTVLWTLDPEDWRQPPPVPGWVADSLAGLARQSSSVLLLHDTHRTTIDQFAAFATAMLATPGVAPQPAASL